MTDITKDMVYESVAPDDFESMLELDRYEKRSTAFDKIISATHDHFWDPLDKKYIDFAEPFDMENVADDAGGPDSPAPDSLRSDNLEKTEAETDPLRQPDRSCGRFSSILHGEQGALEPVGFALPRAVRPGRAGIRRQPDPRRSPPRHRLRQVHQGALGPAASPAARRCRRCWSTSSRAPEVYKKIIGMQMLVEGLAMGAFATFYQEARRSARPRS